MKRTIFFLVLSWFLIYPRFTMASTPAIDNIEEITKFDSHIIINKDTSLSITENIDYFTPIEKHGIYRYIPEKYRKNGLIYTNQVSDIKVSDSEGKTMPFQVLRENGNVTIKIGDPEETFSGPKTYVISYNVENALTRQKDFDELYWDITGEGWQFPIVKSQVSVSSTNANIKDFKCFTGRIGGNESECNGNFTTNLFVFTEKSINYGENFTIAVKLDKNNQLIFPTKVEEINKTWKNNWPLFFLFFPGLIMFWYWYKKGRDYRFISQNVFNLNPDQPQGLRPVFESINIPMVYEPFKDLTPGEAGALLDEKVDNQDVVSEIIDLARKKFLKIERVEKKGFLSFGNDYLFTKLKEPKNLPEQQKYLMENIFDTQETVTLSKLRGTFYMHTAKVKEMINKDLKNRELFTSNPDTARGLGMALAIVLVVITGMISLDSVIFLKAGWPFVAALISVGFAFFFAWNMPQKTAVGTSLSLQTKGLRETIRLGKWREEIKEKHLFIEEVLPFAISLGVISKLTKDMAELNLVPPKYMSQGFIGSTSDWSGMVNDFSSSAASGLSYNPSSSSNGGSGFSGGSSGGGGGGGGGGSW